MKTWTPEEIKLVAKLVNDIDNIVDMDTLLRAINVKMCSLAPNGTTCIGCHYNDFALCRNIYDFLEAVQAKPEDFEEDFEEEEE